MKLFSARTRSLLLGIISLLAPGLLHAQAAPSWQPLGPFGGTVRSLTVSPQPGIVYATAGEHGVFRSLDAGNSWTPVFAHNVTGNLVVDPVLPSHLYVVAQPGPVWRSVDAGASWFQVNRTAVGARTLVHLAVDPASHNRVYAALDNGVALSINGGVSWVRANAGLTPGTPVTEIVAMRRPVGTAFAATAAGLFRTANSGKSWSLVSPRSGLPQGPVARLVAAPSDPRTLYALVAGRGLYRTQDAGSSWKPVLQPPSPDGRVLALTVDPRSPETLYAGVAGGLFRSRDGARSWSPVPGTLGPVTAIAIAVAADPTSPRRLYAGFGIQGIFRSDDGGATWQRHNPGFAALEATGVDVALDDPDVLWTTTPGALFRSLNGGRRWLRAPVPGTAFLTYRGVAAVSSSSVFSQAVPPFPSNGAILRTEDAGASWKLLLDTIKPRSLTAYRLAPSDPTVLYALVDQGPFEPGYGLLRSTDRGDTWEVRSSALSLAFPNLAVAPSDASTVYVTGALSTSARIPKVLRSRDGGATFTDVSAGLPTSVPLLAAVDPNDPDAVYLSLSGPVFAATNGVWKTEDGGATWRQASTGLVPQFAGQVPTDLLATSIPGRAYAVLGNRVFRTDDGGGSWRNVTANLAALVVNDLAASLDEPERVYAATTNGVWRLEDEP